MRQIILVLVIALLCGGGGAFAWKFYGGFKGEQPEAVAFIDVYSVYAVEAEKVEKYVYLPSIEGNINRSELYTLLDSILTKKMEPERRESLARLAFANLDALKKEIETAQSGQAKIYAMLQDLDNASKVFTSIDLRKQTERIVTEARKRAELSARITSILSEINEQTYAIITRILAEKGDLSDAHITEINSITAEAEKRFMSLEGLYTELENKKIELERLFSEFVATAL